MTFAREILKFFHPRQERERMEFRMAVARAAAEAEDVVRSCIKRDTHSVKKMNGKIRALK